MTITVNGPNGVTIRFPEGTDPDTINRVMAQAVGGKAQMEEIVDASEHFDIQRAGESQSTPRARRLARAHLCQRPVGGSQCRGRRGDLQQLAAAEGHDTSILLSADQVFFSSSIQVNLSVPLSSTRRKNDM